MKPHILIIEDDPDIAESIRYNLEREGAFTAEVALTGEAGLTAAVRSPHARRTGEMGNHGPDLVILDLNLPGMSGFELCRRLRAEEATVHTPIIVLTARTDESDKVRGLELGADDYVTKPFSLRELVARVRAALRRSGYDAQAPTLYDDGRLRIDYPGFAVTCQNQSVRLTRKEFALLRFSPGTRGALFRASSCSTRSGGSSIMVKPGLLMSTSAGCGRSLAYAARPSRLSSESGTGSAAAAKPAQQPVKT